MGNRHIDQFPVSGFLFAVFHLFSVLLKTFPVRYYQCPRSSGRGSVLTLTVPRFISKVHFQSS
jgi:hypothetical protein